MRVVSIIRFAAIALVVAMVFVGVSIAWAAEGDSPANAIPLGATSVETCTTITIAPGATMWVKVQYNKGKDLEIYAKGSGNIQGNVFDPNQIMAYPNLGSPVGRLTFNRNQPGYIGNWLGHYGTGNMSAFFYVQLTNTGTGPATFSLCTLEKEQFFPPAYVPVPVNCVLPALADGLGGCYVPVVPVNCEWPLVPDGLGGCTKPTEPSCLGGVMLNVNCDAPRS